MTDLREISRDVIRHKISTSLRARIGHGSKYSVAQVAAQTGISSSTLKGYLGGLAEPSLSQFIKLAAALGPVFASEITGIIDFDVVAAHPEPATTMDVVAAAAEVVARATTSMRAPGRVTHTVDLEIKSFVEDVALVARLRVAVVAGASDLRGVEGNNRRFMQACQAWPHTIGSNLGIRLPG